jgi:flagellar motility protein MotE (MotC chaperone)
MKAWFMKPSPIQFMAKRVSFVGMRRDGSTSRPNLRSPLVRLVGGLIVSTILFWVMVQLGQASSEPKSKTSPISPPSSNQDEGAPVLHGVHDESGDQSDAQLFAPPASQGPAIDVPRGVLEMLERRKRDLDRREEAIRQNEARLMIVRGQIEELLEQNEALEKKIQSAQVKEDRSQAKVNVEKERLAQEERAWLAKMYESMPSEDAAARLERMPDRRAIEILRLVKSKTAGAILSQVKADRAAKLTEQLLAQMP